MRIGAGTTKGRRLQTVPGRQVRPTSGRVRQALFNTLREWVPGCIFVDMFAGTGSVGLEALSQGARHVYFVENDRRALLVLRTNVDRCGAAAQATVVAAALPQAVRKLPATQQVDVLFLDPPYASDLAAATLGTLVDCRVLAPGSLIVWQHAVRREPLALPGYTLWQSKRYGNSQLSFLTPAKGPQ